jgi:hypothetical protein
VFVKEGTSGSLTQRVDDLEDEVEQINTDLSAKGVYTLYTNNNAPTTPNTATLSDSISNYDLIIIEARLSRSGQMETCTYSANHIPIGDRIGATNNSFYCVYTVTSNTELTNYAVSEGYYLNHVYGVKL